MISPFLSLRSTLKPCAMITQGSQFCFFINEYHSELHHSLHCTITNALGEQGVLAVRIQENTADSQMAASSLPYCTYMINTVL